MRAAAFRFFHDQLPDDRQRAFYDRVEEAVRAGAGRITCPRVLEMTKADYIHILEHVYDDHPAFFSFYPLRSEVIIQPLSVTVNLFYRYSGTVQRQYERALEKAADSILRKCFPGGYDNVPELKREKLIFDWITKNVEYDYRLAESRNEEEMTGSAAWNAYGALVLRKAVCEGIACAFKLLCDCVRLPSIVVLGRGENERHAWNIVRVNGKFYHVDCTWDLRSNISTQIPYARYRYFNLPDRIIYANHTPETEFLPVCGSLQYNPFRLRKLCAFEPEELDTIAARLAGEGEDRFAVMTVGFPGGDFARAAAERLAGRVHGRVSYYVDGSGYFVGFVIERRGAVIHL